MQISEINFTPLISELYSKFEVLFQVDTSGKRPRLVHPSIMDQCGIFQMLLKEVSVDFFNFGQADTGYWMTVYVNYEHLDGGSNGMKLMTAWVNEHNVWTFNVPNHQL